MLHSLFSLRSYWTIRFTEARSRNKDKGQRETYVLKGIYYYKTMNDNAFDHPYFKKKIFMAIFIKHSLLKLTD